MVVEEKEEQKKVSLTKLILQAVPYVWSYSVVVSVLLCIPTIAFVKWVRATFSSFRFFMSMMQFKAFFHSWKAPLFCVFFVVLFVLFLFEFVAKFSFAENILEGRKIGFFGSFGIVLKEFGRWIKKLFRKKKNEEGGKEKRDSNGNKPRRDYLSLAETILAVPLTIFISFIFYIVLPTELIEVWENELPFGYHTPSFFEAIQTGFAGFYLTRTDTAVLAYRIVSGIVLVFGNFLVLLFVQMSVLVLIMVILHTFESYRETEMTEMARAEETAKEETEKEETEKTGKTVLKSGNRKRQIISSIALMAAVFLAGCLFGLLYEDLFNGYSTNIVAHRAGGAHASENSLDGIRYAIEQGVYASEVDIRRTRDGVYVINHDDSFERINGDETKISSLTWEEINTWIMPDTTGSKRIHRVYRLEEMLDAIRGREKLFIEFKGTAADERAVDDVMRMVGERGEVEEVVLISFYPEIIEYAEEHYPKVDTGVLLSGKLGEKYNYNCDMILLEQEWATFSNIVKIKGNKKEVGVWTVNGALLLDHFLKSKVDYIITDDVDLVEAVKMRQDSRTDMERMRDLVYE